MTTANRNRPQKHMGEAADRTRVTRVTFWLRQHLFNKAVSINEDANQLLTECGKNHLNRANKLWCELGEVYSNYCCSNFSKRIMEHKTISLLIWYTVERTDNSSNASKSPRLLTCLGSSGTDDSHRRPPENVLGHCEEILGLLEHWRCHRAPHHANVYSGVDGRRQTTAVLSWYHHWDDRVGFAMKRAGKRNNSCGGRQMTRKRWMHWTCCYHVYLLLLSTLWCRLRYLCLCWA